MNTPSSTTDSGAKPLWLTVMGWLLLAAAVATVVFYLFAALQSGRWKPWTQDARDLLDIYDLSRSTVGVTGLLGAAVAAGLATRRQRSNESSVQIARETQRLGAQTYALEVQRAESDSVRQLRERYGAAAGQLGSEASAVRLAGVYAMSALADDWLLRTNPSVDAQACIDVLCAYLRTPHHGDGGSDGLSDAEREVRQTVVRVIAEHLQPDAVSSWSRMRLDFTGAELVGDYNFDGALFKGVLSFAKARFGGERVSFDRAVFDRVDGPPADFRGVQVHGVVSLTNATFAQGLDLSGARIHAGSITARSAEFDRTLKLHGLSVEEGSVDFETATFGAQVAVTLGGRIDTGGRLSFSGAVFDASNISIHTLSTDDGGVLTFRGCHLVGTRLAASDVMQGNGSIDFSEIVLRGGASLVFKDSVLSGSSLTFKGAQITDATVALDQVDAPGSISGPWGPDGFNGQWDATKMNPSP